MDPDLESFLGVALSSDGAVDMENTRKGLTWRGAEAHAALRDHFRELLETRSLTLRGWGLINDLDFDDEDALYTYLQAAYDYLFEGADAPPPAPWL